MICNKTNSDIDQRTLKDSPLSQDIMNPEEWRHTIRITSTT